MCGELHFGQKYNVVLFFKILREETFVYYLYNTRDSYLGIVYILDPLIASLAHNIVSDLVYTRPSVVFHYCISE